MEEMKTKEIVKKLKRLNDKFNKLKLEAKEIIDDIYYMKDRDDYEYYFKNTMYVLTDLVEFDLEDYIDGEY